MTTELATPDPEVPEARFPLGARVRLADLDADPYPTLGALRRDEPVSWVPETRMWFVTRRDDIVGVLRDAPRGRSSVTSSART